MGAHLAHEEIQLEPILEDEIVVFTSASHPLARLKQVTLRALEDETWVIREKGSATRELVESLLARSGFKIQRAITLGCPEAVKAVVAGGLGLAFLSVHGLKHAPAEVRLRKLRVPGFPLKRPIYSARHAKKPVTPLMQEFLDLARAALSRKRRP